VPTSTLILLLEDDPAIARVVALALQREGFEVRDYRKIGDAAKALPLYAFDLLLLDVGLPDGNGLDWLKSLRAGHAGQCYVSLPALMLTAQNDEIDKILGLELGADDYMTKPFSPRELVARVKALLRRSGQAVHASQTALPQANTDMAFKHDAAGQRILYAGQPLDLTRFEYGILARLLAAKGGILARDQLLDAVWGQASESLERTVDTHIKTLRQKLKSAGVVNDPIQTHRGMGYSFIGEL
jgi:two-component system, OmpR family, catabolic regulation response regulator CreB